MAAANRLWGAERIRGELLKLDIRVAKSTIQKYVREARPPRQGGQTWATFLRNHASEIWACDFLPVTDLLFRQMYAFFVIELASRRVVHCGVTRRPTDAWVAQQLREATPFDQRPRYLIRDRDSKYGPAFARVAAASGITELRTAYRAPGKMPPARASSAACGVSASTTSSSWASATCEGPRDRAGIVFSAVHGPRQRVVAGAIRCYLCYPAKVRVT